MRSAPLPSLREACAALALPAGWTAAKHGQRTLFINHRTKSTTFVDPRLSCLLPRSLQQLPPGWAVDLDEEDVPYFIDARSNCTERMPRWLDDTQVKDVLMLHDAAERRQQDIAQAAAAAGAPASNTSSTPLNGTILPPREMAAAAAAAATAAMAAVNSTLDMDPTLTAFELPAGWRQHFPGPDSEPYYVHDICRRVSWTHPGLCRELYGVALERLPETWDVGIDDRGLYFIHHTTRRATRNPPPEVVVRAAISPAMTPLEPEMELMSGASASTTSEAMSLTSMASAVSSSVRGWGGALWRGISTEKSAMIVDSGVPSSTGSNSSEELHMAGNGTVLSGPSGALHARRRSRSTLAATAGCGGNGNHETSDSVLSSLEGVMVLADEKTVQQSPKDVANMAVVVVGNV